MILDQHLTFGTHISEVVCKSQGILGVIARSVAFMPVELLRLAYIALVRSQLEYCSSVFLSAAGSHTQKLEIVQKKASRIILRQKRDAHAEPLLKELKLESLKDRRTAHALKFIRSFIEGQCHPMLKDLFKTQSDGMLMIPTTRTGVGRRRFSVAGAKLFNQDIVPRAQVINIDE